MNLEQRIHVNCEYCRSTNHSIDQCEDPSIQEQIDALISEIPTQQHLENRDLTDALNLLNELPRNLIRVIGVTLYCNVTVSFDQIKASILQKLRRIAHTRNFEFYRLNEDGDDDGFVPLPFLDEDFYDNMPELDDTFSEEPYPDHPYPEQRNLYRWWSINTIVSQINDTSSISIDCPICFEEVTPVETVNTNCNHTFCKTCICRHIDISLKNKKPKCPMCRAKLVNLTVKSEEYAEELNENYCKTLTTSNIPPITIDTYEPYDLSGITVINGETLGELADNIERFLA